MKLGVCYYPEHWPEGDWADDARMMREAGLTHVRIGEFALSVGYAENASFSRAFKAWSGQTPENFRSRRI
jgi:beta-galactosidase